MAIIQAEAKLYQGFRSYVVDKNISASLSAVFSIGHKRRDEEGNVVLDDDGIVVIDANLLPFKIVRTIADLLCPRPKPVLANERYKTYGGGNNIINANGSVNNTNNSKIISTLTCKFPTYFRLDLEALGLPEGTDCVIKLEEGFVIEDRGIRRLSGTYPYPQANPNPNPRNDEFVTFRTPKLFPNKLLSVVSSLSYAMERIRPFAATMTNAMSFAVGLKYFNAQGISMTGGAFFILPTAVKTARGVIPMYASFGPNNVGGMPELAVFDRFRSTPIVTEVTTNLTADFLRLPFIWDYEQLDVSFRINANVDAYKGVGSPHLTSTTSMTAINTVDYNISVPTMSATTTLFCRTPVQGQATLTSTTSISANIGQALELLWETQNSNETIGILLKGPNIDVTLKWSDGLIQTIQGGTSNPKFNGLLTNYYTRNVSTARFISVQITGNLSGFQMSLNGVNTTQGGIDSDDSYLGPTPTNAVAGRNRLIACIGWGDLGLTDLSGAFANATSLDDVPNFLPKTVTNTACMFLNCVNMNDPDIVSWNTSNITTMAGMFRQASQFNQPIGVWNTSKVTSMARMFRGGNLSNYPSTLRDSSFNQSLNGWDVTKVSRENMFEMFYYNERMGGDLSQWCVSHITTVPTNFISPGTNTTIWPLAKRPQWGTCP